MTTYQELLGEPVDVLHAAIKVFAVDDNEGLPIRQLAITLVPGEGRLEIPRGRQGPQGERGEPAKPYIDMGDATTAQINGLTLGEFDAGNSYRNTDTNALHYWSGAAWVVHANAYGAQGPMGPAGRLAAVELTQLAAGASAEASITGPVDAQTLRLGIPMKPGPTGATGPTATISTASDFDSTAAPVTGDVITRQANGKWGAARSRSTRIYSLPESAFQDTGNVGDGSRVTIAQYPLDQVPYATILDISGHMRGENGFPTAVLAVEVRIGDPATGPLVAKGQVTYPLGEKLIQVNPHFSSGVDPNKNTSPTDYRGIVPANHTGNQGTVYVVLTRISGIGSIRVRSNDAQLVIRRYSAA